MDHPALNVLINDAGIMGVDDPSGPIDETKAALHNYSLSQRFMLRGTSVKVQEIAPPWVRTDLLGSNEEPRAMPLDTFIEETMAALGTDAEEVLVERAWPIRGNPGPKEHGFIAEFNEMLLAGTDPVAA